MNDTRLKNNQMKNKIGRKNVPPKYDMYYIMSR